MTTRQGDTGAQCIAMAADSASATAALSQCPFIRWDPCLDSWEIIIKVARLEFALCSWPVIYKPTLPQTQQGLTSERRAHLKLLEALPGFLLLVYHLLCLCCSLQADIS